MFGWSTNFAFPLAGPDATQPILRVLFSTAFDRLNTIPSSMLYPFAALYMSYFIFVPGTIYGAQYFNVYFSNSSTAIKVSFRWIQQELE
jgi:hypothetical protein